MIRSFTSLLGIVLLGAAAYWFWNNAENTFDTLNQYVENNELLTLEARYTPDQIIAKHQNELALDDKRSLIEPKLKLYPFLLMDVKYTDGDKKTREGVVLWNLVDGEMVLNTETWEKTHGFEDAIKAGATRTDFKVLNALAKSQGIATYEQLQKELRLEEDTLDPWIQSAHKKHLIVLRGSQIQLHFENPKILVQPQTKIAHWLVTKPSTGLQRQAKRYTRNQIESTAKAAFGSDFAIRDVREVFLPVYEIGVLNPDGSVMTTFWNALNGQKIQIHYSGGLGL